jgi:hypothetical protein
MATKKTSARKKTASSAKNRKATTASVRDLRVAGKAAAVSGGVQQRRTVTI